MFFYKGESYKQNWEDSNAIHTTNLDEKSVLIDSDIIFMGDSLYKRDSYARGISSDEMPKWMADETMVAFETECKRIAYFEDGKVIVDESLTSDVVDGFTYLDAKEFLQFAMHCLWYQNKYLYKMLTYAKNQGNEHPHVFINGMMSLISNPQMQAQIESLAKTISPKFAISSIINNIDCVSGKKALVLSHTQLHRIKTMRIDESITVLQDLVQNSGMSLEQVERLIEGFRYMIKFKITTCDQICRFFINRGDAIVKKNINLEWVLTTCLKTAWLLQPIQEDRYSRLSRKTNIMDLMNHYIDAISVLPDWKYPTSNVEVFHVISTRNAKILKNRRAEEFAVATHKLRKLIWDSGSYVFSPIQTEDELFYIGERYNNCLPIYRDKIIDEGAIVIAVYKETQDGSLEECPDVVFEVGPKLDIIQIKTFNDEDVTDPDMIALISEWKDSKRYLLTGNRTVYREPEVEKAKKPTKEQLEAVALATTSGGQLAIAIP